MGKKPIIKLRCYRGTELNYDQDGKVKNENNLVSLEHGSKNWVIFMKNLSLNGFCKVEVEKGFKVLGNGEYEPIENLEEFTKEVAKNFKQEKEEVLTADQKRIAELEAKLEAFMNGDSKKETKVAKTEKVEVKTESNIDDVKKEYEKIVGKKPFHGWDEATLLEKIAEAKK